MSQNKKILHDISKMASAAFSSAAGVKRDISSYIREQVEDLLRGMNFVRREEFEAQHKTVLENKKRLDALDPSGTKSKTKAAKPKASKKIAATKTKAAAAPKKKAAVTKAKAATAPKKKAAPAKKTASKKHSPVKGKKLSEK